MNSKVAIIILTWNQRDLTLACLESLSHLDYSNHHIFIVDNGSQDATAETVRSRFPGVTVIENSENLGFAEGNNVGIRRALLEGAEYIMLLNNDTIVEPHMLSALINAAESDPQIGMVGPFIYYYDQAETLWSAGAKINWTKGVVKDLSVEVQGMDTKTPYSVDYISGCALCIKRKVIEKIGLIDPRFFIYYEETDWCSRARAEDYEVLVIPRARIWHKVSASMGTTSPAIVYYMTRNIFLFLSKNVKGHRQWLPMARTWLRETRTIAAHTLKPRYRHLTLHRNVRILALRDALIGNWGKMSPEVENLCYQVGR